MGASVDDFRFPTRNSKSHGDKHVALPRGREQMKLQVFAPLLTAATAAAIGFAPIAAADATVHRHRGDAEITAHPGPAASHAAQLQQPFGGDLTPLLFHH